MYIYHIWKNVTKNITLLVRFDPKSALHVVKTVRHFRVKKHLPFWLIQSLILKRIRWNLVKNTKILIQFYDLTWLASTEIQSCLTKCCKPILEIDSVKASKVQLKNGDNKATINEGGIAIVNETIFIKRYYTRHLQELTNIQRSNEATNILRYKYLIYEKKCRKIFLLFSSIPIRPRNSNA